MALRIAAHPRAPLQREARSVKLLRESQMPAPTA